MWQLSGWLQCSARTNRPTLKEHAAMVQIEALVECVSKTACARLAAVLQGTPLKLNANAV